MNIDRHNYEEYFLLYIDNELNVEQKKQVELFVQENPDLEEELVMLKQSRLIPDDSIVFDKKHLLMKEENSSFINLNNYEQWLIMYVDDELSEEEKITVEKFAETHPHVREELAIFLQTKLQPEELVFPNKETLYKREKTVRVISMQWWRVAVAAVLIISAGVTFYSVVHNKGNNTITPGTVAVNKNEQTPTTSRQPTSPVVQDQTATTKAGEKEQEAIEPVVDEKPERKDQSANDKTQFADNFSLPEAKKAIANNIIAENPDKIAADEFRTTTIEEPKKSDVVVLNNEPDKENINNGAVTNPVIQTPNDGQHDVVNSTGAGTENKKFRGFFRKATRILERTTSINAADDDKVLIGGMAINLK